MISSASLGTSMFFSVVASGNCRLISVSRRKLVDTMKNSTSTSKTSTREMTLISGSSLERLCSLIGHSKNPGTLVLQQSLDEGHRLLLYQHHEPVHAAAQIAIRDQR